MEWVGLVANFEDDSDLMISAEEMNDFPVEIHNVSSLDEALVELESGRILTLAVVASNYSERVDVLLKAFKEKVGCLPDFQLFVCDNPSPRFLISVFEFGVEKFTSKEGFFVNFGDMCRECIQLVEDQESSESKAVKLTQAIRNADQAGIQNLTSQIADNVSSDFKAAYAHGRAMEASGKYAEAAESYASAQSMNKYFRPSSMSLGETLLVTGNAEAAVKIFEKLEKSNPRDMNRKINLINGYTEMGDPKKARMLLEEAEKLNGEHPRIAEAKTQVLLSEGKIKEAFAMLDKIGEAGPFLAAKLNDLGIRLSKAGKGKSAISLYKKAHKVVRPELKYKITLNAALACRRLNALEMALKYLDRCEKEYGGPFEKVEKIRRVVEATLKKQKQSA